MRNLAVVVLGLALAFSPLVPQALAQGKKKGEDKTVRSVSGTVTDASGQAISGAVVHLKDTKTLQVRSFITKDDGSYAFHGLSTNVDYELKAEYRQSESDARTLSVFDSRNKVVINLKLKK